MGHDEFEVPTGPPPLSSTGTPAGPPTLLTAEREPESFQPPEGRNRIVILFSAVLVAVLVIGLLAGVSQFGDNTTSAAEALSPTQVATEFLAAEKVGNVGVMVALSSDSEECLGSSIVDRLQSVVTKIDFRSYNLEPPGTNSEPAAGATTSRVSGVVDIGYVTTIEFLMVSETGEWRVCGFSIE